MGHHPGAIHGVAVEAAAQLVVDATPGHLLQGEAQLVQDLSVPGEAIIVQHEAEFQGAGKLGGAAQTAVDRVVLLKDLPDRLI